MFTVGGWAAGLLSMDNLGHVRGWQVGLNTVVFAYPVLFDDFTFLVLLPRVTYPHLHLGCAPVVFLGKAPPLVACPIPFQCFGSPLCLPYLLNIWSSRFLPLPTCNLGCCTQVLV